MWNVTSVVITIHDMLFLFQRGNPHPDDIPEWEELQFWSPAKEWSKGVCLCERGGKLKSAEPPPLTDTLRTVTGIDDVSFLARWEGVC